MAKKAVKPMARAGGHDKSVRGALDEPRQRKAPKYKSFRVSRRIKHSGQPLSSGWRLFKQSLRTLFKYWQPLGVITIIYILLDLFFVRGFSGGFNMSTIKEALQATFSGSGGQLIVGFTLFTALLTNPGTDAQGISALYQTMLIVVMSLAIIWSLRQLLSGAKIRARDAFYKGMYPLVPMLLVIVVVAIQMLPLVGGNFLYSAVTNSGIAVSFLEKSLWILLFSLLALLSVYMISSSVFALYIVTLPDMTPLKALRSARQLVLHRRWVVLRKVIFLPAILLVAAFVVELPFILWASSVAGWVFFVLSIVGLPIAHIYLYLLYREML